MIMLDEIRPPFFYVPQKYTKEGQTFLNIYDMEQYIPCPPVKYGTLKSKKDRVCRFCRKGFSETSFKSNAHFFPELLGNQYLLSDFECDSCNFILSKYENDLANFLGAVRTINGVSGKNKIPKYKSLESTLILSGNPSDSTVTVLRTDNEDRSISYDSAGENILVKTTCNPYIPLNVYKSLLKIALSVLPEQYIGDYTTAYEYVINKELDTRIHGNAIVVITTFPLTYFAKFPIGMLFKKRNDDEMGFTHVFCLYFQNLIFQMVVPLYKNDMHLYDRREINMPICPLLCPSPDLAIFANDLEMTRGQIDFSSTQLKRDDERTITIPFSKQQWEELSESDNLADNSKLDLNNIVELCISRELS